VVNDVSDISAWGFLITEVALKWFLVAGLLMYAFFTIAVIKQVQIMAESVESDLNKVIKTFAMAQFLLTAFLVIMAIVYL